ncbi:hypothetical protein GUK30_11755 [Rhizobium leguminosarum]|nr:hypothetical protein [Rhizobium ruizarguesonis]NEI20084.1 hypothetical protein [Rhizobium ruizarguesonis]NEJ03397.1 hypothetical protein [Rhizobium ruizarguesonis]NEJ40554.1 hypothetical protein [Rhizobium ruizarguesonis]NEJ93283.1 hypothetical protein [Rhizobium ruizarguesonis]
MRAIRAPRVSKDALGRSNTLSLRIILSENRFRFSGLCARPPSRRASPAQNAWKPLRR